MRQALRLVRQGFVFFLALVSLMPLLSRLSFAEDSCSKHGTIAIRSVDVDDLRSAMIEFCDPPESRTYCRIKDIHFDGQREDKLYGYTVDCRI